MIVEVVAYDSNWRALFQHEKQILVKTLDITDIQVHHIGSTSVRGLAAKPIIDIMLEVTSLDEIDKNTAAFKAIGYKAMGEFGIPGRRYFTKGNDKRTHQIHAFAKDDVNITRHLAFRDYLIAHPEVMKEYEKLKIRVAAECNNDIEVYCDGKDSFIKIYETKALNWIQSQ